MVKFSKNPVFLFTRLNTEHILGLMGLLLTLYETKAVFGARLYGPLGFTKLIDY